VPRPWRGASLPWRPPRHAVPQARVGKNDQWSLILRDGTVKRSITHDVLNHMLKLPEDRIVVGGHGIIRFDRRDQRVGGLQPFIKT